MGVKCKSAILPSIRGIRSPLLASRFYGRLWGLEPIVRSRNTDLIIRDLG